MRAASRRILKSNEDALKLVMQAIEKAGYRPGEDMMIVLGMPPAPNSTMPKKKRYVLEQHWRQP